MTNGKKYKTAEIKAMSATEVVKHLAEYQKWRRGEPPYDYGIPQLHNQFELREIGAVIDRAIELLKEANNG